MGFLSDTIKRKYYFINNGMIYEISNIQDADGCGICPGFNNDGTIKSDEELAAIFPHIRLTYGIIGEAGKYHKYYWLQDLICDGDSYADDKFVCNVGLHNDDSATFVDRFIKKMKESAYKHIVQGYSSDNLWTYYLKFLSHENYTDFFDGKEVEILTSTLTDEQRILSEDNVGKLYVEVAKLEAETAANRILNYDGKKVKINSETNVSTLTFEVEDK